MGLNGKEAGDDLCRCSNSLCSADFAENAHSHENKKNLAALQNDGCLSWRFRDQLCDIDWKSHSGNSAPVKIGT